MNMLAQFLITTALIVGLLLFRLLADRYVLRARLSGKKIDDECKQAGCFHACDLDKASERPVSVSGNTAPKGSAYHAP